MSTVTKTQTKNTSDQSLGKCGSVQPKLRLVGESNEDTQPPATGKQTFVIGDLHGHLDRFEALLLAEGLLDRCPDCDGGGIALPDISVRKLGSTEYVREMRDCPACEGDGWRRTDKDVEVVLVGDIGHFGESGSPTGDLLTWIAAVRWADVILWGNHDRALVADYHHFKGYLKPGPEVYHWIARARFEGKLKLAHEAHGYLITHAGLHYRFRYQNVDEKLKQDPALFADWINEVEHPDADCTKDQMGVRDSVGIVRGNSGVGGILWRDATEKLYDGYPQVFGHSADKYNMTRLCWNKGTTRFLKAVPPKIEKLSYCIDIGGNGDKPENNCLAGIYLPEGKIVTWRR